MKMYIKDGKIQTASSIVIEVNGRQIYNPSHQTLISNGYEEYIEPIPSDEELLLQAKELKLKELYNYDSSENINIFYVQDVPMWLDKATRAGLKLRFDAEVASGKIETMLWYNNMSFNLPLSNAIQMLYTIEIYASECYDNTQYHAAQIASIDNIDLLETYDYSVGYPAKLYF